MNSPTTSFVFHHQPVRPGFPMNWWHQRTHSQLWILKLVPEYLSLLLYPLQPRPYSAKVLLPSTLNSKFACLIPYKILFRTFIVAFHCSFTCVPTPLLSQLVFILDTSRFTSSDFEISPSSLLPSQQIRSSLSHWLLYKYNHVLEGRQSLSLSQTNTLWFFLSLEGVQLGRYGVPTLTPKYQTKQTHKQP